MKFVSIIKINEMAQAVLESGYGPKMLSLEMFTFCLIYLLDQLLTIYSVYPFTHLSKMTNGQALDQLVLFASR